MEKRNLKALLPYIKEQFKRGRDRTEVYEELNLDHSARMNIAACLRRDEEMKEPETYIILPPKKRKREKVVINGKTYWDITEDVIDCGG